MCCKHESCGMVFRDAFSRDWYEHSRSATKKIKPENPMDNRDKEINLLEIAERGELPDRLDFCAPPSEGLGSAILEGKITRIGKERLAKLKAEKEKESRKVWVEALTRLADGRNSSITISADVKSFGEILDFLREKYGTNI